MLEFSETYSRLCDSHSIRKLYAYGDFLVDVGHPIRGLLEGMSDRIMHLTLLTNLLCLSLDRLVFRRTTSDRDGVNFLMRLAVPFVESWEVRSSSARLLPTGRKNSVLCAVIVSLVRFALQRIPLSRYSSGGPQPGTKTKGSQNLYCCIP